MMALITSLAMLIPLLMAMSKPIPWMILAGGGGAGGDDDDQDDEDCKIDT